MRVRLSGNKYLWSFLGPLCVAFLLYVAIGAIAGALRIAPEFTSNFGLDERLQFLKNNKPSAPVGVILGASLASNDVSASLLQAQTGKTFINLGAYGLSVSDSRHLYAQLSREIPVREVIFPLHLFELRLYASVFSVPDSTLHRYLSGAMPFLEETSYRDINGLIYYLMNWHDYRSSQGFSSVAFNANGDVPLDIGPKTTDPSRWRADGMTGEPCRNCMRPLVDLCRSVTVQHHRFTLLLAPYRAGVVENKPGVVEMVRERARLLPQAMQACGGEVIDSQKLARFGDSCFADFAHLNQQGAEKLTQLLLDYRRMGGALAYRTVTCPRYGVDHLAVTDR